MCPPSLHPSPGPAHQSLPCLPLPCSPDSANLVSERSRWTSFSLLVVSALPCAGQNDILSPRHENPRPNPQNPRMGDPTQQSHVNILDLQVGRVSSEPPDQLSGEESASLTLESFPQYFSEASIRESGIGEVRRVVCGKRVWKKPRCPSLGEQPGHTHVPIHPHHGHSRTLKEKDRTLVPRAHSRARASVFWLPHSSASPLCGALGNGRHPPSGSSRGGKLSPLKPATLGMSQEKQKD
ncbi:uncharacterized protein LOC123956102 [Meles meles]|uniref:uncharacterized protein LOC123956102 n=1 Tax=Meles meles TaxID=9662 RepID=UPI001E6A00DC|nr:uncharacterized protein LOC123956102 [Meles meles]